jgi:precorrin-6x reductase
MTTDIVDHLRSRASHPFATKADADAMEAAADEIVRLRGMVAFHIERALSREDAWRLHVPTDRARLQAEWRERP